MLRGDDRQALAPRVTGQRLAVLHAVGLVGLLVVMLGAALVGPVRVDPIAAWLAPPDDPARVILFGARVPRIVLAALVGGALGLAGAALQALLSNPLACPHVLGISGGAALLGIVAMIATTIPGAAALGLAGEVSLLVVPAAAFFGALATAVLVQSVARTSGRVTPHTLLLTGVVFNAFAAAVITFINTLADFYRAHGILAWVVGTVTVRGAAWTLAAAVTLLVGLVLLSASARDLNALGLGEEGATSLGVDVARARRAVYLAVALLVAGAVPVSGMIGFVGLIVPHVVRLLVGADQRLVLPAAMWMGGAFLVVADTAARSVLGSTELPVGVVTALCGGPFFLLLLRRQASDEAGALR
ncbi:MAG TPA: iron ABC transporter permease [Candidatus Binatia bacterium]